jgi:hypothetical protein
MAQFGNLCNMLGDPCYMAQFEMEDQKVRWYTSNNWSLDFSIKRWLGEKVLHT